MHTSIIRKGVSIFGHIRKVKTDIFGHSIGVCFPVFGKVDFCGLRFPINGIVFLCIQLKPLDNLPALHPGAVVARCLTRCTRDSISGLARKACGNQLTIYNVGT